MAGKLNHNQLKSPRKLKLQILMIMTVVILVLAMVMFRAILAVAAVGRMVIVRGMPLMHVVILLGAVMLDSGTGTLVLREEQ